MLQSGIVKLNWNYDHKREKKQRTTTFCVYLLKRTRNIKTCVAKNGARDLYTDLLSYLDSSMFSLTDL